MDYKEFSKGIRNLRAPLNTVSLKRTYLPLAGKQLKVNHRTEAKAVLPNAPSQFVTA